MSRTAKPRSKPYDVWDDVIAGLGLRVGATGHRSFFLRRSVRGRKRYAAIGNADETTVPEARQKARKRIAAFIDTVKKNDGPRTPGRQMHAFAEEFLERYARHWKPTTLVSSTVCIRNYILPAFGHLTVDAIAAEHVKDWFASMAGRPGMANRSMPVLSTMMKIAELWGYRPHNSNPCKNTKRYRMTPKERFLSTEEMARLNAVLIRDEFYCPQAVAVIRLLMLTGCRVGEIVSLQWDWIKGGRIHLPDSKSGPRTVWLSSAARSVIDAIPRYSEDCPFLFPARPPTRHIENFANQWHRIRDEAGLSGVRLHDLRHTWASVAAMNGVDMVTIAKLLGHALVETTEPLRTSFRSVRIGRRRPGVGPDPCGPGRKGSGERGRVRSCQRLTSPRAWPARAGPATRTRSCSTGRSPASAFGSTPRAGRSGSCRHGSRDGAEGS